MIRPLSTRPLRLPAAALAAATLLLLTGSPARAEQVYAKPPSPAGGVNASSWVTPDGSDSDMYAWEDFTLPVTQTITEVRWRGGYALGAPYGKLIEFRISIFESIPGGSQPLIVAIPENESQEQMLVNFHTGNNAGETPAGTFGGVAMYDYRATLPTPFVAQAGIKYWIRFEAAQPTYPDWGVANGTGGNGSHFRYSTGLAMFQNVPGDLSFSLHARWTDLGGALAGTAGLPALAGSGTLAAGSSGALALSSARPSAPATLLVGLAKLEAPFKGGTMVPSPQLLIFLPTNASGGLDLHFTTPAGLPPGTLLVFQFWVGDPVAVAGFAASNGLSGTTP